MQGLTEVLFRRCYETCFPHVIDRAVSPFISLTHGNLAEAEKKIHDVLPANNKGSIPVVPQILGREADEFVQLAQRLGDLGYNEVNWNIGCPMRRVAGKHRGSGILPHPDEVERLLDAVLPQLHGLQLSIKMRLGYSNADEIFTLIPILNSYPLASVTIHPRTGRQQYGGEVDLVRFARAASQIVHPVIYNGDIVTESDYRRIKKAYPQIAEVMIGRGILYDPLLPHKIKGLPTEHPKRFVEELIGAILHTMPSDEAKIRKIKEYWCLLRRCSRKSENITRQVLHSTDLQETIKKIEECLER